MTFLAPRTDSRERVIRSSRHWQRIWIETSSGIRFSSISRRVKSNSIWEAEGNPTSISLKPIRTSRSKNSSFSSTLIGWARAWLPSRRSTLHQRGARVSVRPGHCRPGRATGGKGRYLLAEAGCMGAKESKKGEIDDQGTGRSRPNKPTAAGRRKGEQSGSTRNLPLGGLAVARDRKSTRLNSSHTVI